MNTPSRSLFLAPLLLLATTALADIPPRPRPKPAPPVAQTHHDVVKHAFAVEHRTLAEVLGAFKEAAERADWQAPPLVHESVKRARELHQRAHELHQEGHDVAAYHKLHEAHEAIRPAVLFALQHEHPAPRLHQAVARQIGDSAEWIADLAPSMTNAPPAAHAAYREARELYQGAKALHQEGRVREAFVQWHQALAKLDEAIRLAWK